MFLKFFSVSFLVEKHGSMLSNINEFSQLFFAFVIEDADVTQSLTSHDLSYFSHLVMLLLSKQGYKPKNRPHHNGDLMVALSKRGDDDIVLTIHRGEQWLSETHFITLHPCWL